MTPFWTDDHLTLYGGDCREVLASMEPESVHCVVTSPPYFGLRDYGTEGQLGLEDSVDEYVADMVAVFREVRRVMRSDATLWLNLGDSYAGSWGAQSRKEDVIGLSGRQIEHHPKRASNTGTLRDAGVKPKDLYGIPWRVAFALQADGWYLRSDVIWSKPNPMPESVTDRPTKAHEYLFLLSKAPRYFFDGDAVRESSTHGAEARWDDGRNGHGGGESHVGQGTSTRKFGPDPSGRNLRSVWTIATEPYPGAHFATFPRKLVEPCIKAGTSERGVCPECGAPWERLVERGKLVGVDRGGNYAGRDVPDHRVARNPGTPGMAYERATTGWKPSCECHTLKPIGPDNCALHEPVPATVLDPFAGSGTTLLVAQSLGRRGVGIDLNPDYLKQALVRNAQTPLGLVG